MDRRHPVGTAAKGREHSAVCFEWHRRAGEYCWCMARTTMNLDEKACAEVMRRYRLRTKREAVNFALRIVAAEPFDVDGARRMRGSGWEGDLDVMRTRRTAFRMAGLAPDSAAPVVR